MIAVTAAIPAVSATSELPGTASDSETNATYYNNATIPAADPYVLYDDDSGYYYAYSTDGANSGYYFGVYRSPDLVTWEKASNGAIQRNDPNQWGPPGSGRQKSIRMKRPACFISSIPQC